MNVSSKDPRRERFCRWGGEQEGRSRGSHYSCWGLEAEYIREKPKAALNIHYKRKQTLLLSLRRNCSFHCFRWGTSCLHGWGTKCDLAETNAQKKIFGQTCKAHRTHLVSYRRHGRWYFSISAICYNCYYNFKISHAMDGSCSSCVSDRPLEKQSRQ